MIKPSSPNTDNSPWYELMEQKAEAWNAFARKNDAEISGLYNAYKVEFNAVIECRNGKIGIYGLRALINLSAVLIPRRGRFSEVLRIDYSISRYKKKNFVKLYRKGLVSGFVNLFSSYRYKTTTGDYIIKYNDKTYHDWVIDNGILGFEKLNSFEINNKGISIVLYELPQNANDLEIIPKYWESCIPRKS